MAKAETKKPRESGASYFGEARVRMQFIDRKQQAACLNQLSLLHQDLYSYADATATYAAISKYAEDQEMLAVLNRNPAFWNTVLAALQNTTFTTLGRIHDDGKNAYLKSFLKVLAENALPAAKDAAKRIKAVRENQNVFIQKVLILRHNIFAHTSNNAQLHIHFGFENLTLKMFEDYWRAMSGAYVAAENAIFLKSPNPAMNTARYQTSMDLTHVLMERHRNGAKALETNRKDSV